ncbi:Bleomycin hydrolase, partial [Caligus rogercresseyi]
EKLQALRSEFLRDEKNILAQNIVSTSNPQSACMNRGAYELNSGVFSHKLSDEGKPVCNQRASGRCWLFAALNAMRFEFSQSYLFFCDKIERANFFLHKILEVMEKNPDADPSDRLLGYLLTDPLQDGGQWGMVAGLVEKYGVLPKKCFPESFSSESSYRMNNMLSSKLRQFCRNLVNMSQKGTSKEDMLLEIEVYMEPIYRTFVWEYYDKSKAYKKIGPISPLDFYQSISSPYGIGSEAGAFCWQGLRCGAPWNACGGSPIIYNNQSIETLLSISAESIKDGSAVWCGLDMTMFQEGIMDLKLFDHELTFGTQFALGMGKADRLRYRDSAMGHAVTLTGVSLSEEGAPSKWRIENSWGKDFGQEGYLSMTSDWFREFGFEIVVKKDYVPQEIIDVFKMEPIVLPAWDPMGVLA